MYRRDTLKRVSLLFISLIWIAGVLFNCHAVYAEGPSPSLPAKTLQPSANRPDAAPPSSPIITSATTSPRPAETPSLKSSEGTKSEVGAEKAKNAGGESGIAGQVDLSAIEKSVFASETAAENAHPQPYQINNLIQFGYNFFRPSATGFAPLTDAPVGPDYVIGPGDRIILNLWGSVEGTYELEVNRSGEIVLPRVGNVKVWGITFERLPGVIKASLSKILKDFELNVTMGKLRVIKVYVVGEVKEPGDYNLSPLSTLINALSASGGPLKTGTLRNIQVKRGGKVVETVDLYDFFLKGDKSRDIRLQPGDTIFVPVIGRVAGIAGNVKRPAIYELREEKNMGDLIALAEGFLPTGYLQRVQISRVDAHEKKVVADFNIDPKVGSKSLDQILANIKIQDMDIVKIFPIDATLRDHVRLNGYVLRPGDYALQPGMRLSQLLLQDNLLPEYYKDAAEITRLYPPDYHPEKIFVNIAKALAGNPEHDLELKEFDEVRIFSRWEMEEMPKIRINGEVQRPGEYRLFTNMTVRDLLLVAGNTKITAYMKNAEINRIKQTGEVVSSFPIIINLGEAIKGNPKDNLLLAPFDELSIRKIPNWAEEKERYVTLQGEFRFPGVYPIHKGERLSTVIERAGGFTDKAYLRAAKFTRVSIQELQQKRMDEFLAKSEQELLKKQAGVASVASSKEELEATRSALESLQRSIALLKTAKAEGRLVIRMDTLDKFKDSPYDMELRGGDLLEVPQMPNSVNVLGQVYNPTSFIPIYDDDVAFYLEKAGGPTRDAEESDIYVVRADGTVLSRQQSSMFKSLFFSGFMTTTLEPGDTVIVPQKFEKTAWMRDIKDMAVILGNLALAAGVMVAAGL
jgi:protein involved in polysaccharide export with SLBB domain